MKHNFKTMRGSRKLAMAAIAVPLALALSSCGISGSGSTSNSATKAGNCDISSEAASGKALTGEPSGTITFQTTALKQSFGDYFTKLIADFEAKYPKVKVDWQDDPGDSSFTQRLITDAQSCNMPDVVNLNQSTAYALYKENFLLNLSKAAPGSEEPFISSLWDSLKFPGSDDSYVMPWYWGLSGLQTYNTELMTKAGLDPANPPSTILEQFAAAKKIAAVSDGQYYAFATNPKWRVPNDWQLMDAKIMDEDQTKFIFADDSKILEWLAAYKDAYLAGGLQKDQLSSDSDMTKLYSSGTLVWGSTNASFLRYVKDTDEAVYNKTGVGVLVDSGGHALQDGQMIAVPSVSKNPTAAVAFAKFLLSADEQSAFASLPGISVLPSTTESLEIPKFTDNTGNTPLDKANRLTVELAKTARNSILYPWSDAVNTAIVSELQLAINGTKDPAQALKDAQDKANSIIDNAKD